MREDNSRSILTKEFFVGLFIFLDFVVVSAGGINAWELFINNPSQSNYALCMEEVDLSLMDLSKWRDSPTYRNLLSNEEIFGELVTITKKGNKFAVELMFKLYPLTYKMGGINEEINISLGSQILIDAPNFLKNLKNQKDVITGNYLNSILAMYGDEYVDRNEKKIYMTKKRIEELKKIQDDELQEMQSLSIEILSDYLSQLLSGERKN